MKPRAGIFGLSGCWGEQIVILNCEDRLLDVIGAVELVDFVSNDQTIAVRVTSPVFVGSMHKSRPSGMLWNGSWVAGTYTRPW